MYYLLSWEQYCGTDRNFDVNILRFEHPFHESFHTHAQGKYLTTSCKF